MLNWKISMKLKAPNDFPYNSFTTYQILTSADKNLAKNIALFEEVILKNQQILFKQICDFDKNFSEIIDKIKPENLKIFFAQLNTDLKLRKFIESIKISTKAISLESSKKTIVQQNLENLESKCKYKFLEKPDHRAPENYTRIFIKELEKSCEIYKEEIPVIKAKIAKISKLENNAIENMEKINEVFENICDEKPISGTLINYFSKETDNKKNINLFNPISLYMLENNYLKSKNSISLQNNALVCICCAKITDELIKLNCTHLVCLECLKCCNENERIPKCPVACCSELLSEKLLSDINSEHNVIFLPKCLICGSRVGINTHIKNGCNEILCDFTWCQDHKKEALNRIYEENFKCPKCGLFFENCDKNIELKEATF